MTAGIGVGAAQAGRAAAVGALPLVSNSSDEGELFVMLVLGFCFGLYLVYDGFKKWQTKRLIEDTPTAKVRSMAVGRTELEGTAHSDGETIEAPFTDEQCLHVDWEIEEWRKDPDDDDYDWVTIASGSQSVAFHLDDGTGRVLVRADTGDPAYEISPANRREFTVDGGEPTPPEVREFIDRHDRGDDDRNFFENPLDSLTDLVQSDRIGHSNRRRRYSQSVLPDDSPVYVLASAVPREGTGGAGDQLLEITRDENLDTFIVSDRGEDELESYYEKRGPLELAGGLALSAICLGILLYRFNIGL